MLSPHPVPVIGENLASDAIKSSTEASPVSVPTVKGPQEPVIEKPAGHPEHPATTSSGAIETPPVSFPGVESPQESIIGVQPAKQSAIPSDDSKSSKPSAAPGMGKNVVSIRNLMLVESLRNSLQKPPVMLLRVLQFLSRH